MSLDEFQTQTALIASSKKTFIRRLPNQNRDVFWYMNLLVGNIKISERAAHQPSTSCARAFLSFSLVSVVFIASLTQAS
jgi:hypothetical protein